MKFHKKIKSTRRFDFFVPNKPATLARKWDVKQEIIVALMDEYKQKIKPTKGVYSIHANYYLSTNRRIDLDNLAKVLLDALTGIFFHDDTQVVELVLRKEMSTFLQGYRIYVEELKRFS